MTYQAGGGGGVPSRKQICLTSRPAPVRPAAAEGPQAKTLWTTTCKGTADATPAQRSKSWKGAAEVEEVREEAPLVERSPGYTPIDKQEPDPPYEGRHEANTD